MDLASKEILYKQYQLSAQKPPRPAETYFCYWFKGTKCYRQGAAVWDGVQFLDPDPENLKGRQPTIWLLPYEGKKKLIPYAAALSSELEINETRYTVNGIGYEPD
jgi:hypothetical protein